MHYTDPFAKMLYDLLYNPDMGRNTQSKISKTKAFQIFAGGWGHPPVEPAIGGVPHRPENYTKSEILKCTLSTQ